MYPVDSHPSPSEQDAITPIPSLQQKASMDSIHSQVLNPGSATTTSYPSPDASSSSLSFTAFGERDERNCYFPSSEHGHVLVMILGDSGSGKSTLVNALCKRNVLATAGGDSGPSLRETGAKARSEGMVNTPKEDATLANTNFEDVGDTNAEGNSGAAHTNVRHAAQGKVKGVARSDWENSGCSQTEILQGVIFTKDHRSKWPQEIREALGDRQLTIIDTPGLNKDSSDFMDILTRIEGMYAATPGEPLGQSAVWHLAILQDIASHTSVSEKGMTNDEKKRLTKICGKDALKQAAIVTTKWDCLRGRFSEGKQRVEKIMNSALGKYMASNGGVSIYHLKPKDDQKYTETGFGFTSEWDIILGLVLCESQPSSEGRGNEGEHGGNGNGGLELPDGGKAKWREEASREEAERNGSDLAHTVEGSDGRPQGSDFGHLAVEDAETLQGSIRTNTTLGQGFLGRVLSPGRKGGAGKGGFNKGHEGDGRGPSPKSLSTMETKGGAQRRSWIRRAFSAISRLWRC